LSHTIVIITAKGGDIMSINNENHRKVAKTAFERIVIGKPIYHGGLTVFPLMFQQTDIPEHISLENALEDKTVEITEISEDGSVPELLFANNGKEHVLLVDGEELIGAKQNRIINLSMLVAAESKLKIPVSCVEAGRWHYKSRIFSAGAFAPTSMRSRTKSETMNNARSRGVYMSNQHRVWNDVDRMMGDLGTHSESSAMHDGYEAMSSRLAEYTEMMKLPSDASGYIACIGKRVLGGDVFATSETLQKKWHRIIRSVVVESIRTGVMAEPSETEVARDFLSAASDSIAEPYSPPGIGSGVHIEGDNVIGNVLIVEEAVLHISIFAQM